MTKVKRLPKFRAVPHYSGNGSRSFWARIHREPDPERRRTLYLLGCALQDMEGRMLQLLAPAADPDQEPR